MLHALRRLTKGFFLVAVLCFAPALWAESEKNPDPWEGFNRTMFGFNDFLDRWILRPISWTYRKITPKFVDDGVSNVFDNLDEIRTVVHDVVQLKFGDALSDTSRFVVNTTLGIGGIYDIASGLGLPKHEEDFGQSLGHYGVGPGPYLVLPFLGPATVRDGIGRIPDTFLAPQSYLNSPERFFVRGGDIIDTRADLIPSEDLIVGDRYTFIRDAFLQRREFLVKDGQIEDDFVEDDLGGFGDFDEEALFGEDEASFEDAPADSDTTQDPAF